MKRGSVTLADVARMADVSENTASRAIRNKGYVAPETRRRVNEAIEKLGYVPNRAAGALASSSSPIIGVILPSLSNIVFPELLRGIHAGLAGTSFQPMIGVTDYDPLKEQQLIASLLAWNPAALITTGMDHTDTARGMLEESGIRIAELMDIDEDPIDLAIGLSHFRAGQSTARHLMQRGYSKIAYVGHDWNADRRAFKRYQGLRKALSDRGISLVSEQRYEGPSSTLAGRETLAKLLDDGAAIEAVVFSNDDMAVGGFMHCMASQIDVPKQLALFGFNGLEIGQALPKPLSTILSNRFNIGQITVETLLANPVRPAFPQIIDTGYSIITGETA